MVAMYSDMIEWYVESREPTARAAWTVTTNITATPNERQDILIHLPFDYLFSSFFQADIKENVKIARHCPSWGASNDHHRIPIIKHSNAKKYPFHDIIMNPPDRS